MSSIRHSVSSPDETPRSSSKIPHCASYFQLSSRFGDETLRLMLDILHETCNMYVHLDLFDEL